MGGRTTSQTGGEKPYKMDGIIDTAIIIDIYRGFAPAIAWRDTNLDKRFSITPIVWMEAIEGAQNKNDQRKMLQMLSLFSVEPLHPEDGRWAMHQVQVFRLSHNVTLTDALIAAPAHRLQLPLYTRNTKHFLPLLGDGVQQPY